MSDIGALTSAARTAQTVLHSLRTDCSPRASLAALAALIGADPWSWALAYGLLLSGEFEMWFSSSAASVAGVHGRGRELVTAEVESSVPVALDRGGGGGATKGAPTLSSGRRSREVPDNSDHYK
jgi:hypothetical protein